MTINNVALGMKHVQEREPTSIGTGSLILLAAVFFCLSLIPGATGNEFFISYGWRFATLLLAVCVFLTRGGLSFSKRYVLFYLPYVALQFLLPAFRELDGFENLIKNIILVTLVATILPSHDEPAVKAIIDKFFRYVLVFSLAITIGMSASFLASGWSWSNARHLKAELLFYIPFNTILFQIGAGIILVRFSSRVTTLGILFIFLLFSLMMATRTPAIAWIVTWIVISIIWQVKGRFKTGEPLCAWIFIFAVLGLTAWLASSESAEINRFLAGRQALWISGFEQWATAPLMGDSSVSLSDAILRSYSYISFAYDWEVYALLQLQGGGYHSVWIQALVTSGLLGLFVVTLGYAVLLSQALKTREIRLVAFVIFLILRGSLETGGMLFSTASTAMELIVNLGAGLVLVARPTGKTSWKYEKPRSTSKCES